MISKKSQKQIKEMLTQGKQDTLAYKIKFLSTRYPKGQQKSVVIEALKFVQKKNKGFLTDNDIKTVAKHLQMSNIEVAEVATFYENFNFKAVGKYQIRFCHNISCMLNGADDLIKFLEEKLDIKVGGVTRDGRFSLKKVECLGACVGAPMMQIGDNYYENLTKEELDEILDNL